MLEHRRAVGLAAVDPFMGLHPGAGISKQPAEVRLALGELVAAPILAGELDQVECIEEHPVITLATLQQVNDSVPLSSHAMASPSIVQEGSRAIASEIKG